MANERKKEALSMYSAPHAAQAKFWLVEGGKGPVGLHLAGADFKVAHGDTPEATLRTLAKAINDHPAVRKVASARVRAATVEKPLVLEIVAEIEGASGNEVPCRALAPGALRDEGYGTLVRGADEWWYVSIVAWDSKGAQERVLMDSPSQGYALQHAMLRFKNAYGKQR